MTARHILSVAQTLDGGGVERALLRLAAGWVASGRRVTLAIGDATGPLSAELPEGVAVVPLSGRRYVDMLALPDILRMQAPDVLFCPGNHYTGVAAWTKVRLGGGGPPIVAKLSNAVDRGDHNALVDAGHRAWLALHGKFLDHLVAMTPATAASAEHAMRMTGRISVIPNPPARTIGKPDVVLPAGPVILGVGRLAPQKRWDRMIAALPALDPAVSLVILGEGALRAALTAQAEALGVAARVHLPGHSADPIAVMAKARVLVLASDYEGVPGVLREALSVGTPVVTTDSTLSIAEIVTAPTLGTIVARDDGDALVAALRHWLDAPRPAPVPQPGADSAERYLALFDRLTA